MGTATVDLSGLETEQPVESTQPESVETPSSTEFQPENQSGQQTEQLDGRKGPQNIRGAIKAASEALPDQAGHYKELGNAYFREQAYKQHFPTPQEAATAKQLIEGVGGIEGVTTLQSRAAAIDLQDNALKAGDPAVLDSFFKDFPQGAVALAPAYMERLQKADPAAFSAAIAPHAIAMLDQAGLAQHLETALNEPDLNRKNALLKQAFDWMASQKQATKNFQAAPQKNPAEDRLKEQQTQLQQEREELFVNTVREKVNSAVTPELTKAVDQYAKQYKLSDTQKAHFQETLQNRVVKEMNGDKTYLQQVELRKQNKARTHDTIASYISSEFNRRITAAAFAVAKDVYGAPKTATAPTGVPKPGQPQTATGGAPLKVSQRPADSELDLSRPGADLLLIKGQGYTKAGKFVAWR
jgi:hypothetical protein